MARRIDKEGARRRRICPHCKVEFVSYRQSSPLQCPSCGRPVRLPLYRLALRVVGVLAAAILVAIAVYAYLAGRSGGGP
jgi:ribosomal protein L37AE/L43A